MVIARDSPSLAYDAVVRDRRRGFKSLLEPELRGGPGPARCLDCGYVLEGLKGDRCPECGREFDLYDARTFTLKPPLLRWRLWLPGLLLAGVGGFLPGLVLLAMGNWGWALWLAMPFAAGVLLGYRVRAGRVVWLISLAITVLMLVLGLVSTGAAGAFCGVLLAIIMLAPIVVGTWAGAILRFIMKQSDFSQRWHLPALLILLFPVICGLIEGPPSVRHPSETITTSAVINAPVQACWDGIVFYEEVKHKPPLILRIGLAHPLRTIGRSSAAGDVKTCVYNKGHITKRIEDVQPLKRLAFTVIEQDIGYERDVRLEGGSFNFEPLPDGTTRVTLTTTYQPLLQPRWCWRSGELIAMHTLHRHVLRGIELEAQREQDMPTDALEVAHADRD